MKDYDVIFVNMTS